MKVRLNIIASCRQHFDRLVHLYQIPRDQVKYISNHEQLYGLDPYKNIIIFGDEWWFGRPKQECEEIERIVSWINNKRTGKSS